MSPGFRQAWFSRRPAPPPARAIEVRFYGALNKAVRRDAAVRDRAAALKDLDRLAELNARALKDPASMAVLPHPVD
jgi:hypothetical protein